MTGLHADERWRAHWVPVDRRLLGMDRRTLLPAAVVVLLFVIAVWVVPAIDDRVAVDDPIRAGDVIQVGTDVQFVPVAGANLLAGLRQGQPGPAGIYPGTAAVSYGGVTFEVIADTYRGTPAELLAQIKKTNEGLRVPDDAGFHVTGDPVTITNGSGDHGVAADFEGTNGTGLVAAFVFGETGVEVEIVGPQQVPEGVTRQVVTMLQSVEPIGSGS
ncbi:hypothetical protein Ade02nite_91120 [Paractinoplanes deccanensis]|uniref:Uncharacterized protein n=1 Tax=Paractinoplanes deccanensis TaxID=113561 RepID=A0ABQ3YKF7_9ACTN|nr:hypothetical protein [Actinoplanes deccanensis]GID80471.1 hypothetical protein Ade02nite_91120 [Actinoplanes deccanensis]